MTERELPPPPASKLPSWDECSLRVHNSNIVAKRVAEGGYGPDHDSKLASELHRFIYEYDDVDDYRSAWFRHRLELLLADNEARIRADERGKVSAEITETAARIVEIHESKAAHAIRELQESRP
jgi:hypothetical protein